MTSNVRYKLLLTLGVTLVCLYGIVGLPTSVAQLKENVNHNIHLGLDLKGGSHLVMQIQLQDAFKSEADTVIQRMRTDFAAKNVTYTDINRTDPQTIEDAANVAINVLGVPGTQAGDFRVVFNENYATV